MPAGLGSARSQAASALVVAKGLFFHPCQSDGVAQSAADPLRGCPEDLAAATGLGGVLDEPIAAFVGEPHAFKPRVGQLPIPALKKMVQRRAHNGVLVGQNARNALVRLFAQHVHDRHAQAANLRDLPGVKKPGDHPVRLPLAEPRRYVVVQRPLALVKRPRAVGPRVVGHAVQHHAAVAARGLNQQHDAKPLAHAQSSRGPWHEMTTMFT